MSRAYHPPTRHPFQTGPGHWEGDIYEGKIVDRWVPHCPRHADYLLDGCDKCAEMEYRPTTEGPDAPRPG